MVEDSQWMAERLAYWVRHLNLSHKHQELLKVSKKGSDRVLWGKGWFRKETRGKETNKKAVNNSPHETDEARTRVLGTEERGWT